MSHLATARPVETFLKGHGRCSRCGRDRYIRQDSTTTDLCRACYNFQLVPCEPSDEPDVVWVQHGGIWRQHPSQRRRACDAADPALFDSVEPLAHLRARKLCGGCRAVEDCIQAAVQARPEGTWGGLLWLDGVPLPQPLEGRAAA